MIEKYLKLFVLDNKIIIIAEIGAFLNKNANGEKQILFSPFIKNNDGLLEKLLAEKEKISIKEAQYKIGEFASKIANAVEKNEKFEIEDFGYFTRNLNKEITFVFNDTDVKENATPIIAAAATETKETETATETNANKNTDSNRNKHLLAYIILLVLLLIIFFMLLKIFKSKTENNINATEQTEQTTNNSFLPAPDTINNNASIKNENGNINTGTTPEKKKEEPKKVVENKEKPTKTASTTDKKQQTPQTSKKKYKYEVIAGCFVEKANAEKLVKELKTKGFPNAKVSDRMQGKLYAVVAMSTDVQIESVRAQNKCIELGRKDAWVRF